MKQYYVYITASKSRVLYTGVTNDLDRRIATHRAGRGAAYTRSRLPVRLVYTERRPDRGAAQSREAAIKRLPRAAKLALTRRSAR